MAQIPRDKWEQEWQSLSGSAIGAVSAAKSLEALEQTRLDYIGRKGSLTLLLKALKDLPIEDKRRFGPESNKLKAKFQAELEKRKQELESAKTEQDIAGTAIDLSLPARPQPRGRIHPITSVMREMTGILSRLGFAYADGPNVETEHYNFEMLNIPAEHPARDMQDTFYLDGFQPSLLMRTHTSPVQIRHMENHQPPIRIMAPGRVFRHEAVDASHSAVFHQIEGLYVDKNVSMADLKGTLDVFIKGLFGPRTKSRLRASFFPFTEPSVEVDVQCLLCAGDGCPACKQGGWMEMLGAGIVNSDVLRGMNIDPEVYSGFAFGIGVERIAMLRLGIPDIRMFYENDVRFLEQFG
jgi:phenylalanyl-tRNA synthetase alpha chain